jgi:hypothetical protein
LPTSISPTGSPSTIPQGTVIAGRLIAVVTDPLAVKTILAHLGQSTTPPEVARARGPPLWDPVANWDDALALVPQFVFDQRLSW